MTKDLKNDSADYSSLILKELTHDWEKNVLMLQELRNRNRENGNLVRELDRLLLTFLPAEKKEEFVGKLFYEIYANHKEGMLIVSRGFRKVVPEEEIPDIQMETLTGRYGQGRARLIHTDHHVILAVDNGHSELLSFLIDYFGGEPHGTEVLEDQAETINVYRWEKKRMGRLRTNPDERDYLFTVGSALMGHGLYSYAVTRFEEVLKTDPDDHETLLRLSDCFIFMGLHEPAVHFLRRAASVKPGDVRAYKQLGECYHRLGLPGMALENLLRARDLEEEDREIHNSVGVAYALLEDYDKSIEAYRRALEIDSGSTLPWRNIGLAYERSGRFDEAIEAYERYAELDSQNQEPHIFLGELFEEMGDHSRAAIAYQRALEIRPDYFACLSLGRVYEKVNRAPDARKCYEEALKIYPHGKEPRAQLFRLDHPDMEYLQEEMAQVVKDHPFLRGDLDAVPVIYEEAKRRKEEREEGETTSKQDGESFGLN